MITVLLPLSPLLRVLNCCDELLKRPWEECRVKHFSSPFFSRKMMIPSDFNNGGKPGTEFLYLRLSLSLFPISPLF